MGVSEESPVRPCLATLLSLLLVSLGVKLAGNCMLVSSLFSKILSSSLLGSACSHPIPSGVVKRLRAVPVVPLQGICPVEERLILLNAHDVVRRPLFRYDSVVHQSP